MSGNHDNLTWRQQKAIGSMLISDRIEDAAEDAGVSVRTIYRWLKKPVFVAALRAAESRLLDAHVRGLIRDLANNRDVIGSVRDDGNNSPGVRLRAAVEIDRSALRWRSQQTLTQQLEELEQRMQEIERLTEG